MSRMTRALAAPVSFAVATALLLPLWAGRDAAWLGSGDAPALALSRTVADRALEGLSDVGPREARFDGEWRTVTCAFGALGMAQVAERHPEERDRLRDATRSCLQALQTPEARSFAIAAWGVDGGTDLAHRGGHAWLGYEALALAVSHRTFPDDPWIAARHGQVHDALVARLNAHSPRSLQTYPGETYPPDQAVLLAAVELGGHDASAWRARWRAHAIDPHTGLLFQRLDPSSGAPSDVARGSGTTLAAWALGLASLPEADDLWTAIETHLLVEHASLAAIREVPPGSPARMDVDSGPVVLGLGLSASGFALGASRAAGDRDRFTRLHRLAWVVGAPAQSFGRRRFVAGGAVGDALLLAAESTPWGAR